MNFTITAMSYNLLFVSTILEGKVRLFPFVEGEKIVNADKLK